MVEQRKAEVIVNVSSGGTANAKLLHNVRIAVLVPCYNEAPTVAEVIRDFRDVLPFATIYVYDNNSSDRSAERAADAGALVRRERHQGKGHVVRRMFADVDAALYVMVDRDGTYDAAAALGAVIELVENQLDFINIARRGTTSEAYRPGFTSLATLC